MSTTDQPIRVVHFADLHIGMENFGQIDPATGVNQRVLDFVQRLADVVTYALDHEADLVIFAGDAFKTRDPNPTYQRELARQLMRLSQAGTPTVLLVGNHDVPIITNRATSVDIFRTLGVPNIVVGRQEELHLIQTRRGPVQVATAPWPQRQRLLQQDEHRAMNAEELDRALEKAVAEELEHLAEQADPSVPAILTAHFTIGGAKYGSERTVMVGRDTVVSLSALHLPAWDYVALGHVHKHQDVNPGGYPSVVYPGSLERVDFGEEAEPKGFCWVELRRGSTSWSFVPVKARHFVTVDVDAAQDTAPDEDPTGAILRAVERHAIADAVVRVRVVLTTAQEALLKPRDVEKAMRDARFYVGITKLVQRDKRARIGVDNAESLTPSELLDRYFMSRNLPRERIDELMALARGILDDKP